MSIPGKAIQHSANSTSQRFQKLRNECKDRFVGVDDDTKKATPRKPKASTTNGGTLGGSTGKRKANQQREDSDDDETKHVMKKIKTEEKEDSPVKEDSE